MDSSQLLTRRIEELIKRCIKSSVCCHTAFLDPGERELIRREVFPPDAAVLEFYGGKAEAERSCAVVYPSWSEPDYGFAVLLCASFDARYSAVTHRDVLGSLLALGIERETIGDIYCAGACAYFWVLDTVSDFICTELVRIGGAAVKTAVASPDSVELPEPEVQPFKVNVTSLRLDSVLAAAYGLSRSEASAAIAQGLVKVDHLPAGDGSKPIPEGTLLSLRGKGRVRFKEISGTSKKGRFFLLLEKFI